MKLKRLFSGPAMVIDLIILLFIGWGYFQADNWAQLGLAALACLILGAVELIIVFAPRDGDPVTEEELDEAEGPSEAELAEEAELEEFLRLHPEARKKFRGGGL